MQRHLKFICFAGAICMIAACSSEPSDTSESSGQEDAHASPIRLELLSPEATGVDFNNALADTGRLNVFIWNFLYSGAGVAAGDINNDGLPDLYFAGNQVPDKLYLNKGDFVFEDISATAGIVDQSWSTGVTMADVNADGLLDIYVCKNSASTRADLNRNKLYINQGDGRFENQAADYGVDDPGFSTQATFFDVDNDGDLDMYLVNQPVDQFAQYVNPPQEVQSYPAADRLFVFDDGQFSDVAGEQMQARARYGLSASLIDIDLDGWTDVYIANDYHHGDHLYMNDRGGLYDELAERIDHTSFYSMGTDAGDINNDGHPDLAVLDMAFSDHYRSKTNMESMDTERFWSLVRDGQHYQYAVNTLQLNKGDGTFSEIAQMAGVAKSDWSWTALFADLDNDSYKDLAITNGIMRDMKNNDFTEYVASKYGGRVGPENFREILDILPSVPVPNKLYRNAGHLKFEDVSSASGFDFEGFSHGLAYADLDQDGKLDLVVNNMNAPAGIYRNASTGEGNYLVVALEGPESNRQGQGLSVVVYTGEMQQVATMQTTRGYFSASEPILHFGLGMATAADSVRVIWNHREQSVLTNVQANQRLTIAYETSHRHAFTRPASGRGLVEDLPFQHSEQAFDDYRDQVLLPYKLSQNGPALASADVDGNGLQDVFVGGAAGQPGMILMQDAIGNFSAKSSDGLAQNNQFEDTGALFLDYDNDGDQDLLVVSGSNEIPEGDARLVDRMYENDGQGNFSRDYQALPSGLRINGQSVAVFDLEGDGDSDLLIGGRVVSGRYPLPPQSTLLINTAGKFETAGKDKCDCLEELGLVTSIIPTDVDADGDQDLLVVGEWMVPTLLMNDNGVLSCNAVDVAGSGLWWSAAAGDFDGDGDDDYLLGNLGWNNKFGGRKSKLGVYAGDFDQNGDHDVVLAKHNGPEILPVRGRECSSQEMPFVLDLFPSYDAYGRADLDEILTPEQRALGMHAELSTFTSVLIVNEGGLQFTTADLPEYCQTGPIKSFSVSDIDNDGNLDFVYVGNHHPTEVETARFDGLIHGVGYGDGAGGFRVQPIHGLHGDYRHVVAWTEAGATRLILAQNDGPLQTCLLGTARHELQ